ncbi:type IV pilus biogenesis/stability protein PilW [Pseudomonas matsuisoli]|uniref:Type IV pilus biogenesis/stability protein PilW n=1 Tax=Pseudomonas matsuisoli TaxID=1515666 RepID=A0A917UXE7_9PSED|nr:type IV pilus biogenesis/stability protein PilW [Pseudomonas matsuisoli]GGJ92435.1 type IV pilus biogenesis/stability protein PilW [Pseudomonas matsuisoli]
MKLRVALVLLLPIVLSACVTSGQVDPMDTQKGRSGARDAYIQLGIGYLQKGYTERAKGPLSEALKLDPSNADAHTALALVFQTEAEPTLADKHYREALSSRPKDARILNNYGSFLYEQKRYQEAYQRFEQASQDALYGERSRVFENMGIAALALGNRDLAKEHFSRSLRLNRQQPRALLEMAQLSYEDREYVPARSYYDRYSQMSTQQTASSLLLGIRLAKIFEDRDTAASYGLQLKRLYPGSPEYQKYLSEQR